MLAAEEEEAGAAATAGVAARRVDGNDSGADFWRFLPGPEELAAALATAPVPDGDANRDQQAALLGRSAVAGTFTAALELARDGALVLAQPEGFGAIQARGVAAAANPAARHPVG